jgi:predicted nucleic acid-binding protein
MTTPPAPEAIPDLVLVDSSYYLTLHRQNRDPLGLLKQFEHDYDLAVNGIIWAEVVRGQSDPHVRRRYERAFSVARRLELPPRGWQRVAELAWELDRRGEVIPLTDLVIAVTAIEHRAAVLTFDRHFQRIPGVVAVSDLV